MVLERLIKKMNGNSFISLSSPVFNINMSEYKTQGKFISSRIRQDKSSEEQMRLGYQGRELYEMIQNADDEKSPDLEISLEGEHLYIRNWGDYPFTEGGIVSILRSFLSPKKYSEKGKGKPIGCKGLGFRSLLNWGSDIYVRSNGVCCHFSEDIAKRKWEILKKDFDEAEILSFEAENICPIPILSVTEYNSDGGITRIINQPKTKDRCTTEIEIIVNDSDVQKDVENKIKTLPSTVLLFLKSVRKITLRTESYKREISCDVHNGPINQFTSVRIIETECGKADSTASEESDKKVNEQDWTIYTDSGICEVDRDKCYEVAVAFTKGMPSSNHVYSFFPTEFVLNLPCILHGTFVLDDSRNRIPPNDKMNNYVFTKLGAALITVSKYLANEYPVSWKAFDIVNISRRDAELVPALAAALSEVKSEKILPTIKGYSNLDEWVAYSEELASWLEENSSFAGELSYHLIPDYKSRINTDKNILSEPKPIGDVKNAIDGMVEELLAQKPVNHLCYARFIDALQKSGITNVGVLYDSSFQILDFEDTSYVVSADSEIIAPPSEMNLNVINRNLVEALRSLWSCRDRDVTRRLKGESEPYVQVANVSDSDLSAIKEQIIQWSRKPEVSEEDLMKVLKWLYKSDKNRNNPLSHEMMLFGRDGQKHAAASVILPLESNHLPFDEDKATSRYILNGNSSEWALFFETEDIEDVESFFFGVVGVSYAVPLSYQYFGNKCDYLDISRYSEAKNNVENWRFDAFSDKESAKYGYNYAWVPCREFVKRLDLPEAIGLFANEPRLIASIDNNILRYKKGNGYEPKTEQVKFSYASFFIGQFSQFSRIKTISLYDNLGDMGLDYDEICKKYSLDRLMVQKILLNLGAKYYASELSMQNLYDLICGYDSDKNVERFYHSIRDAIQAKRIIEGSDLSQYVSRIEYLFARKNGVLGKFKRGEVYYWDNDQLPKDLLNEIPKLEIGSRIGEESVEEIFGISLAKRIKIDAYLGDKCERLTDSLFNYLNARLKYILALRCREISDDNVKKEAAKIKGLLSHVGIFSSCKYRILESEGYKRLKKGEFLVDENEYRIVYDDVPVEIAIHDPAFCSTIEEIFSIAFKLTGKTDFISMVIKNSQPENEYAIQKNIRGERWEIIKSALGVSSKEKKFLESVFSNTVIDESILMSRPQKRLEYLNRLSGRDFSNIFGGGFPVVDDLSQQKFRDLLLSLSVTDAKLVDAQHGLRDYYRQVLENQHQRDKDIFEKGFYQVCHSYEQYIDGIKKFNEDWFMSVVDNNQSVVLSDEDLLDKYFQKRLEIANIDFSRDYDSLKIKESYASIESKLNLNDYDRDRIPFEIHMMVYFDGMEKRYSDELRIMLESEHPTESVERECEETYCIGYGTAIAIIPHESTPSTGRKKSTSGSSAYVSSERLHRIGKAAELKVFKAMKADDSFKDITPFSSNLTGHKSKDDVHYDLTYKRKDEDEVRFLEIKSKSGDYFLMSKGEYEFARSKENVDRYDVAIVEGNDITILSSPFSRGDLVPEADTIRINLEIEKQSV